MALAACDLGIGGEDLEVAHRIGGVIVAIPAGSEVAIVHIVVEYAHLNGLDLYIHIDLCPHLLQQLCHIGVELAVGVEILKLQVVVLVVAGCFHQCLGLFEVNSP